MAAQSIASRPKRAPQTESDDVVLARALEFTEWARRNVMIIGIVAAVLVVTIAGFFWYRTDQVRREDNAAVAFLQVEQSVGFGSEEAAVRDLRLFIQQHGGTSYGEEARVMLGEVLLRQGQTAEAIDALRPVADRLDRSPVGAQAAMLMAASQQAAGQQEQAIQTYLRVANETGTVFRRQEALLAAALLRDQQGDSAGAAELFRRLVDLTEPNSPDRLMFEMRLAEAEARATQR
jgi:predicted negative regulator of RcsB-dependent stress response